MKTLHIAGLVSGLALQASSTLVWSESLNPEELKPAALKKGQVEQLVNHYYQANEQENYVQVYNLFKQDATIKYTIKYAWWAPAESFEFKLNNTEQSSEESPMMASMGNDPETEAYFASYKPATLTHTITGIELNAAQHSALVTVSIKQDYELEGKQETMISSDVFEVAQHDGKLLIHTYSSDQKW